MDLCNFRYHFLLLSLFFGFRQKKLSTICCFCENASSKTIKSYTNFRKTTSKTTWNQKSQQSTMETFKKERFLSKNRFKKDKIDHFLTLFYQTQSKNAENTKKALHFLFQHVVFINKWLQKAWYHWYFTVFVQNKK